MSSNRDSGKYWLWYWLIISMTPFMLPAAMGIFGKEAEEAAGDIAGGIMLFVALVGTIAVVVLGGILLLGHCNLTDLYYLHVADWASCF